MRPAFYRPDFLHYFTSILFKHLLRHTIPYNRRVIMCRFAAPCGLKGGGWGSGRREDGCRRRRALISSLMDFISGVSVRNHAFIMGVTYGRVERGRVTGGKTPPHEKQTAAFSVGGAVPTADCVSKANFRRTQNTHIRVA